MFPTGLLPQVLKWAEDEGITVKLDDRRKLSTPPNLDIQTQYGFNKDENKPYELRHYQLDSVKAALKGANLPVYFPRGIIKVATAGGKTLICAALIRQANVRTLLVLERVNLMNQTKKKFVKEYGFDESEVGVVGGGENEQGRLVTIVTIQSSHLLNDLDQFEMLISDEAHHSKAKTYINLYKNLKNCYYRFGLSGTPLNGDPQDDTYRISQFGDILFEIPTHQLIKEGVLSKPIIRVIEINKPWVEREPGWHAQYEKGIVTNFDRNNIIINFAKEFDGKVLILFKIIEHGKILHKYLPKSLYVDGETSHDIREKIFEGFNKSTEGILICSTIADEGLDFSGIDSLIVASAGKSLIKVIQRLGRGLRPNDNMQVNVIDFYDRTCTTLEKHSRARIKIYKDEGHSVKIFKRD